MPQLAGPLRSCHLSYNQTTASRGDTPALLALPPLQAIWEELQETVHAVDAMVTKTPEEAGM